MQEKRIKKTGTAAKCALENSLKTKAFVVSAKNLGSIPKIKER